MCWVIRGSFPCVVLIAPWLDCSGIEILKGDLLMGQRKCWLSSLWERRACSNGETEWSSGKEQGDQSTWFWILALPLASSGPWAKSLNLSVSYLHNGDGSSTYPMLWWLENFVFLRHLESNNWYLLFKYLLNKLKRTGGGKMLGEISFKNSRGGSWFQMRRENQRG